MLRRNFLRCVAALAILGTTASSVLAGGGILDLVPKNALAWVVVNNLSKADAKSQKIANKVQAPTGSLLTQLKTFAGIKNGLDEQGALGGIVMPGKTEQKPAAVFFVPVTDYKEFLGNFDPEKADKVSEIKIFGKPFVIGHVGDFALIADPDDQAALESVMDSKESIAGEVRGLENWLSENDISAVATKKAIATYSQTAKQLLEVAKAAMSAGGDANQAQMTGAMLDVYGKALDGAGREISLGALGVRANDEGTLHVLSRVQFVADGSAAKVVAEVPAASGDLLAGLPPGQTIFAGAGMVPKGIINAMMNMSIDMMKANPKVYGFDAKQAEKLAEISKDTAKSIKSMSGVMLMGNRNDPLYSNLYGIFRVENSGELLELYQKQIEATNEIVKESKETILRPTKMKKLDIAGKTAIQLDLTIPMPKMEGPAAAMNDKMKDIMFGPGGQATGYLVAADEHTVLFGFGVSEEKMVDALPFLKDPKKGLSADPEIAVTSALLPAGSQWVGYISIRGYMGLTQRLMGLMMGDAPAGAALPAAFKLPSFAKSPPLGLAVKAEGGEIHTDLVVPAALFDAIGDYVTKMKTMFMQQLQQQQQPQVP